MKPTKLTIKQWNVLKKRLATDYSTSVVLIRSKMRERLGFTTREHSTYSDQYGTKIVIYLDWFDDAKRTMFMLKYSEYFDASKN